MVKQPENEGSTLIPWLMHIPAFLMHFPWFYILFGLFIFQAAAPETMNWQGVGVILSFLIAYPFLIVFSLFMSCSWAKSRKFSRAVFMSLVPSFYFIGGVVLYFLTA